MVKKILCWIGYVPIAVVTYFSVLLILENLLPYLVRILFLLLGFDYTPEPYLFEFENTINNYRQSIEYNIELFVTLTFAILVSSLLAGFAAGFVGSYICPSKNRRFMSIPITMVLALFLVPLMYFAWNSDLLYRSILFVIATILSIFVCYITCVYFEK